MKARRRIDVLCTFDVEDIFSPPELGNDDSIKELADIVTEERVPAVFLFIGDRAEQLVARGRHDVTAAVARHEVGLHTRTARHPCPPDYVAGKSWDQGFAEALRREGEGVAVIEKIFGRKACALSTHNVFTSPHAQAVAGKLGVPFIYSYAAAPPLYSLSWYCGSLGLPVWNTAHSHVNHAFGLEWDDVYPDDARFRAQLAHHDRHIDAALAAGQPFLTQFLYHPQRLRLAEFIDHFWAPNGACLPPERFGELGNPRRYTDAQVAMARTNFRHFVRTLRDDPRLRLVTLAEVVARHGQQRDTLPISAVLRMVGEIDRRAAILSDPELSAAEALLGMAEALIFFERENRWPDSVKRRTVLGPKENPILEPERRRLTWPELIAVATELLTIAEANGHLPANFGPVFQRFGVNHLYVGLANAVLAANRGFRGVDIMLRRAPRCPPEGEAIGRRFLEIADGELVDPALDIDALYRHGKLQTWTLKAARFSP